jgi:hypothetical protein
VDVDVTPPLEDDERRAVLTALELAGSRTSDGEPYRQAWLVAGLHEAIDDEAEVGYAFSPRSTRGATRA